MLSATAGWLECRYVDSGKACRPQGCRVTPGRTRLRRPDPAAVAERVSINQTLYRLVDQGSGTAGQVISASRRAASPASTGPGTCGEGACVLQGDVAEAGDPRPGALPGPLAAIGLPAGSAAPMSTALGQTG
jgi:hypothetical protein